MIILHTSRVDSGNGKNLDLEILLNQIGGIFKSEDEAPVEDIHYKQHCLPKYAKLISNIGQQQYMIAMGTRSFRNQVLQIQNNRKFLN